MTSDSSQTYDTFTCSAVIYAIIMMAVDNINYVASLSDALNFDHDHGKNSGSKHKSTIHSGSFMVSRVHDVNNEDDDEENTTPFDDDAKGFDFINANKETSRTYNFGDGSQSIIENSLTKLFECMTLAYR